MNHDAHNYERKLKAQLRLLEKDPSISESNKKLINEFKDFAYSSGITTGKMSTTRRRKPHYSAERIK